MEILRHIAGSRLFGTNTPQSDTDYRAVHLPSSRELYLGNTNTVVSKSTGTDTSSNTAEDEDYTSHSFQRYIQLLTSMEVGALETLFAYPEYHDDEVWPLILENKELFLNDNLANFVGYAKGQAMRYAVRGERLVDLQSLLDFLAGGTTRAPLGDYLKNKSVLPRGTLLIKKKDGIYLCCHGRSVPIQSTVGNAVSVFSKPVYEAGQRTKNSGDGPDWKGVYHAHRVIDEGLELFTEGVITFPVKSAQYLLKVRNGEIDIEKCLDFFEEKASKLEAVEATPFQRAVDIEKVDDFIVYVHRTYCK